MSRCCFNCHLNKRCSSNFHYGAKFGEKRCTSTTKICPLCNAKSKSDINFKSLFHSEVSPQSSYACSSRSSFAESNTSTESVCNCDACTRNKFIDYEHSPWKCENCGWSKIGEYDYSPYKQRPQTCNCRKCKQRKRHPNYAEYDGSSYRKSCGAKTKRCRCKYTEFFDHQTKEIANMFNETEDQIAQTQTNSNGKLSKFRPIGSKLSQPKEKSTRGENRAQLHEDSKRESKSKIEKTPTANSEDTTNKVLTHDGAPKKRRHKRKSKKNSISIMSDTDSYAKAFYENSAALKSAKVCCCPDEGTCFLANGAYKNCLPIDGEGVGTCKCVKKKKRTKGARAKGGSSKRLHRKIPTSADKDVQTSREIVIASNRIKSPTKSLINKPKDHGSSSSNKSSDTITAARQHKVNLKLQSTSNKSMAKSVSIDSRLKSESSTLAKKKPKLSKSKSSVTGSIKSNKESRYKVLKSTSSATSKSSNKKSQPKKLKSSTSSKTKSFISGMTESVKKTHKSTTTHPLRLVGSAIDSVKPNKDSGLKEPNSNTSTKKTFLERIKDKVEEIKNTSAKAFSNQTEKEPQTSSNKSILKNSKYSYDQEPVKMQNSKSASFFSNEKLIEKSNLKNVVAPVLTEKFYRPKLRENKPRIKNGYALKKININPKSSAHKVNVDKKRPADIDAPTVKNSDRKDQSSVATIDLKEQVSKIKISTELSSENIELRPPSVTDKTVVTKMLSIESFSSVAKGAKTTAILKENKAATASPTKNQDTADTEINSVKIATEEIRHTPEKDDEINTTEEDVEIITPEEDVEIISLEENVEISTPEEDIEISTPEKDEENIPQSQSLKDLNSTEALLKDCPSGEICTQTSAAKIYKKPTCTCKKRKNPTLENEETLHNIDNVETKSQHSCNCACRKEHSLSMQHENVDNVQATTESTSTSKCCETCTCKKSTPGKKSKCMSTCKKEYSTSKQKHEISNDIDNLQPPASAIDKSSKCSCETRKKVQQTDDDLKPPTKPKCTCRRRTVRISQHEITHAPDTECHVPKLDFNKKDEQPLKELVPITTNANENPPLVVLQKSTSSILHKKESVSEIKLQKSTSVILPQKDSKIILRPILLDASTSTSVFETKDEPPNMPDTIKTVVNKTVQKIKNVVTSDQFDSIPSTSRQVVYPVITPRYPKNIPDCGKCVGVSKECISRRTSNIKPSCSGLSSGKRSLYGESFDKCENDDISFQKSNESDSTMLVKKQILEAKLIKILTEDKDSIAAESFDEDLNVLYSSKAIQPGYKYCPKTTSESSSMYTSEDKPSTNNECSCQFLDRTIESLPRFCKEVCKNSSISFSNDSTTISIHDNRKDVFQELKESLIKEIARNMQLLKQISQSGASQSVFKQYPFQANILPKLKMTHPNQLHQCSSDDNLSKKSSSYCCYEPEF